MSPASSLDHGHPPALSTLHSDILRTHILTRLDGPALASAASASSQLRLLSTQEQLWRDICVAAWPSITDPRVQRSISAFATGHRSFFSDVFPLLDCWSLPGDRDRASRTSELISAVDIHYQGKLLFSKVHSIETQTTWFLCSPFRVDLIDPKDSIPSPLRRAGEDEDWLHHLEENLTLSWIVIDPTKNRAANISSGRPVKVQRHWLSGDIQVRYATIMAGDRRQGSYSELVQCGVVVNLGEQEEDGVEMKITEVSMQMLDMKGKHLNGKDSLGILEEAIAKGKRIKAKGGEGKQRYEEYREITKKRTARKERIENAVDMLCIVTGITISFAFLSFILFR